MNSASANGEIHPFRVDMPEESRPSSTCPATWAATPASTTSPNSRQRPAGATAQDLLLDGLDTLR
jgi:hypothetical protein